MQNMNPEAMSVTPVPGQTLVTVATATVTANNGQTVTIPVQGERKATKELLRLVPVRVLVHSKGPGGGGGGEQYTGGEKVCLRIHNWEKMFEQMSRI